MYTEIKEFVNFLSRYMHFRLPRHKVCLYAEQLGNALVLCYHNLWILNGPKKEEDARILHMKFDGKTSDIFLAAARDIGLEPNEVLFCLPERLLFYINPGEVIYRAGENAPAVPIWVGDIHEDTRYSSAPQCVSKPSIPNRMSSNMGAAGKPVLIGKTAAHAGHPTNMDPKQLYFLDDNALIDWHVPLVLCHPREFGYEHAIFSDDFGPNDPKLMFRYTPSPQSLTFTVESFAATRFGSHRSRPDHELMRRIQRSATAARKMPLAPSPANSDTTLSHGMPAPSVRMSSVWPASAGNVPMLSFPSQMMSPLPLPMLMSTFAYPSTYSPLSPGIGLYPNRTQSSQSQFNFDLPTSTQTSGASLVDTDVLKTLSPAQQLAVYNLLKQFQSGDQPTQPSVSRL